MPELVRALSLRQPWAWLLVEGIKPVENRRWNTKYRGRFYVHAAKGMTRQEYDDCEGFCAARMYQDLPAFDELLRGGIVGSCILHDVAPIPSGGDPIGGAAIWQMEGQYGFLVSKPRRLPFVECRGALSFWRVLPRVITAIEERERTMPSIPCKVQPRPLTWDVGCGWHAHQTFVCRVCKREVCWCQGASDSRPAQCNACWSKAEAKARA